MTGKSWQGFGFGEIGYLLIQDDLPAVAKAREVLDLVDHAYSEDVSIAAVSSLVAHGLLEIDAEGFPRPLGAAAVLTYAFAEATRWTRIGFFSQGDEAVDGAVLISSPSVTAILQPRQGGAWLMLVRAPDITDVDAVWALIAGFRDEHAAASAFIDVSDVSGGATLFVERRTDTSWTLALGESTLWPEQRRDGVGDADIREVLHMALTDDLSTAPSAD